MSKTITTRDCETAVVKQTKIYDDKCPGFFVQVAKSGEAAFFFRYRDKKAGNKQIDLKVGVYVRDSFGVVEARAIAFNYRSRADQGESLFETLRQTRAVEQREGKSVDEVITAYIDYIKVPVQKADGLLRPRIETWESSQGYLKRFLSRALGSRSAASIDNDDIAVVSEDIVAGKYGKPSVSNARHFRSCASAMFKWAAQAGRKWVKTNPCRDLPPLDKEYGKIDPETGKKRVLTPDEIRLLWWGLDREDAPCDRQIALSLKFELVTMLRSKEYVTSVPSEFRDFGTERARFEIPLRRVKKRRNLVIPLSPLAQEIITEARTLKGGKQPYVFPGDFDGKHLDRGALAHAVRGYTDKNGRVVRQSIWKYLGIKPFTPHDLRRTCATLAGNLGYTKAEIAMCLDHRISHGDDAAPTVTDDYELSERIQEKKKVLDAVAVKIREIIGSPAGINHLKLVA